MRVDSFVFLSSFYEAIEELEDNDTKLELYEAICRYAIKHESTELKSPVSKAMMKVFSPLLEAQYHKRMANIENGKKGGRPKGVKAQSVEETEEKTQINPNLTDGLSKEKPKKSLIVNVKWLMSNGKWLIEKHNSEFVDALKEFMQMREVMKKPMTEEGLKRILSKLESMGDEQVQIQSLRESVDHCWQGVFPPKQIIRDGLPTYDASINPVLDEDRLNQILRGRQS